MSEELTIREALDHARAFYSRMVKPFEKLPAVLDAAQAAETTLAASHKALDALMGRIADATAAAARAEHEAEQQRQASLGVIAKANADARKAVADSQVVVQEWNRKILDLDKTYRDREAALRESHEALTKELGDEIARQQKTLNEMEAEQQRYLSRFGR